MYKRWVKQVGEYLWTQMEVKDGDNLNSYIS